MQIFVTSPDPVECARALDNKRLVKMVLETTQILSSVVHQQYPALHQEHGLYRPTHLHHPCVIWAAADLANFSWLVRHLKALSREYTARYSRTHACARFESVFESLCPPDAPAPTSFANCARNTSLGLDFTSHPDVFEAYRLYLNARNAA